MPGKKLSIITINYNNKKGLLKTIESIVNQTFNDFEFIIIDGGSTDGSLEIIKEFSNKIDYSVSEPDRGIYNAMNKGIIVATGEYCNFMNSGDCFYDGNILEKVFKNKTLADILIGKAKTSHRIILPPVNPTFNYFYTRKSINHQAAFIKRKLLIKYPYDEINLKIVSDWKFFFDALIIDNCSYKSMDEFIVNFDDSGIGSSDITYNILEQSNVIKSTIYPRILEDYNRIQYLDSAILRISIPVARFFDRYGKFLTPSKYYKKLKKLILSSVLFITSTLK
jgi:glycosyltransferase involved in cell wall biosynthesis